MASIGVAPQDAEVPLGARNLDLVHLLVHERTFAGRDLQLQVLW
jgi:hypothetical protein